MSNETRGKWALASRALAALILVAMSMLAIPGMAAPTSAPIKIGAILPLSSVEPVVHDEEKRGFELAIEHFGRVQGRQIELTVADVTTMEAAQSEARRLIKNGVQVLIGTAVDSWDKAVAPICERSNVVFWLTLTGGPELTEMGSPWVFRTCPVSPDEGKFQAQWFVDDLMPRLKMKPSEVKAGLIYRDDSWGATMGEAAAEVLKKAGIKIAVQEYYSGEEIRDMSPVVLKMKAAGVNAVFTGHFREAGILFWDAAKKYDFNPVVAVGTGAFEGTDQVVEVLGAKGAECIFSSNYPPEHAPVSFAPDVPRILKSYRDKYGESIRTPHVLSAYTGMRFLIDALSRTENLDSTESIRKAIMATDIPQGKMGVGWGCSFSTAQKPWQGMIGQNTRAFYAGTQFINGELWQVYPEASPGKEVRLPMPKWNEKR